MTDLDASDLVCRSRRERLSVSEEQRLRRLLAESEEARFHTEVLDAVERESCVQPGDDALVARLTSRALRPATSSARRRLLARAAQIALALMLVGAASGALGWSGALDRFTWLARPGVVKPSAPGAATVPHKTGRAQASPARGDEASASASSAPPGVAVLAPDALRAPAVASAASAPELLARANLARREGRTAEAQRLYRAIVSAHPRAREAPLAHLALGKLLEAREPALALSHFGALATTGGGLRAEGLWGQAECARRLELRAAEQQALETLVRQFPASPYAEAARGRMRDASP